MDIKRFVFSAILSLIILQCYSQSNDMRMSVRRIESRKKENDKWGEWRLVPDNKKKEFVTFNFITRLITWESHSEENTVEKISYQIVSKEDDSRFEDFIVYANVMHMKKLDSDETVIYKCCYIECEESSAYRLITNADEKATLQFRYLLSER